MSRPPPDARARASGRAGADHHGALRERGPAGRGRPYFDDREAREREREHEQEPAAGLAPITAARSVTTPAAPGSSSTAGPAPTTTTPAGAGPVPRRPPGPRARARASGLASADHHGRGARAGADHAGPVRPPTTVAPCSSSTAASGRGAGQLSTAARPASASTRQPPRHAARALVRP
ncbi:MAG TPA: hypothetical protein VMV92_04610 [Streptosporangiaceae bacterium]|nr:hypothetical protein [Streptosporangiaceae bacterium]